LGIIEGLLLATPDILAAIPELVASMIEAFAELGPQLVNNALEWGMDFIASLVQGITNAIPSLINSVSNVAATIAEYLHFSVPDKGPLADFDESGGDMIDEFISSMQRETPALESALYGTSSVIYNGVETDYTGALAGISSQLGSLSVGGLPPIINVYLGSARVGSVVTNALDSEYYLQGGT
jgi:hypothetical protein